MLNYTQTFVPTNYSTQMTIRKLQILYNACRASNTKLLSDLNITDLMNLEDHSQMLDTICGIRKDFILTMIHALAFVITFCVMVLFYRKKNCSSCSKDPPIVRRTPLITH